MFSADWPEEEEAAEEAVEEAAAVNEAPRNDEHEDDGDDQQDEHHDHPVPLLPGQKCKRCRACYSEAGARHLAMKVKRVFTSCQSCGKPFCVNHLSLYCGGCNDARLPQTPARRAREQELEATVDRQRQEMDTQRQEMDTQSQEIDRQRQQIDELQQQVRVLVPLVSNTCTTVVSPVSHRFSFLTLPDQDLFYADPDLFYTDPDSAFSSSPPLSLFIIVY